MLIIIRDVVGRDGARGLNKDEVFSCEANWIDLSTMRNIPSASWNRPTNEAMLRQIPHPLSEGHDTVVCADHLGHSAKFRNHTRLRCAIGEVVSLIEGKYTILCIQNRSICCRPYDSQFSKRERGMRRVDLRDGIELCERRRCCLLSGRQIVYINSR